MCRGIPAFLFLHVSTKHDPQQHSKTSPHIKDHRAQGEYYLLEGVDGLIVGEVIIGGNKGVVGAVAGFFFFLFLFFFFFFYWT